MSVKRMIAVFLTVDIIIGAFLFFLVWNTIGVFIGAEPITFWPVLLCMAISLPVQMFAVVSIASQFLGVRMGTMVGPGGPGGGPRAAGGTANRGTREAGCNDHAECPTCKAPMHMHTPDCPDDWCSICKATVVSWEHHKLTQYHIDNVAKLKKKPACHR
jgi:hypothetical protein